MSGKEGPTLRTGQLRVASYMSSHVRVVTQKSHESDRGSQVTRFDSHVRQGSSKSGNIELVVV